MNPAREGAVRHGTVRWLTEPPNGHARVHVDSGAFAALPLSIQTGRPKAGETTPGELLAAAYSALLATYLAQQLERDGVPARELMVDVWSRLSLDVAPRKVEGFDIEVRGRVPGLDDEGFGTAARAALALCREALGICGDLDTKLRVSLPSASGR